MFHKVPLFFLSIFFLFSTSIHAMEHLEHCRHLIIQTQLSEVKEVVQQNQDILPSEDYKKLIYHITISQNTLNQVSD